ncbi:MAG TPA: MFS transporter [Desulfurella acetivorans]|nr:MAG: MFS transporter [Thermodesulfobium narugense]HEX13846.1 MFS transporter [Desulfurella acetivorans]
MSEVTLDQKRMLKAAFLTFFIDMFDVYLPITVLAPAMEHFVPKSLPVSEVSTIYFLIFTATLIGRPVGAFLFGHYSDAIGRKKMGLISISGFSIVTLLLIFIPGFQTLGYITVALFILLRFIDGIFLGGGYTSIVPLAIENAPKEKRGLWGGIIGSGYPVAFVIISIITLLALKIFPKEAYQVYGWRIIFVIGVLLGVFIVYYIHKLVPESTIWLKVQDRTKSPLKELFSGKNFVSLLQVLLLMLGLWFQIMVVAGTMSIVFIKQLNISPTLTTTVTLVSYLFLIGGYISAGWVSQKIGRKTAFIILGILIGFFTSLLYYLLIAGMYKNMFILFLFSALIVTVSGMAWGIVPSYINERFQTSVRASAYGVGYTLSILIASFYSFYMLALKAIVPYKYTQIVLLVFAGILVIIGAILGPETKEINMEQ